MPKYALRVVIGSDGKESTQVPGLPSALLVTHWTSGALFQLPRTVTPSSGLCRESCAVIRTFAVQLPSGALTVNPSRFPTCTFGGLTVIAMAWALLLEFASGSFCVAVRMCPATAAP